MIGLEMLEFKSEAQHQSERGALPLVFDRPDISGVYY